MDRFGLAQEAMKIKAGKNNYMFHQRMSSLVKAKKSNLFGLLFLIFRET